MSQLSSRFRLMAIFVVMLMSLTAVAPMAAAQNNGGNSDAAHACQQGGFENLKGADGTRFASTGECVSFAAQGGELLELDPRIMVSFDPTFDQFYCYIQVDLVDFDPATEYPVTLLINGLFDYDRVMTTDATGSASGYPIGSFKNTGNTVAVTSNGIEVGPFPITCAP